MPDLVAWLASAVVAAIITVLVNDPLKYLLARLFGDISLRDRSLRGIWKGSYDYETEGAKKTEEQHFLVRQIGKYVVAKTIFKGTAYYKLTGKLDGHRFLTGRWEERTLDGRFYHGAFQLAIRPQGKEMVGVWVGYNRHDVVMSGSWLWLLENPKPTPGDVARLADTSGEHRAHENGAEG